MQFYVTHNLGSTSTLTAEDTYLECDSCGAESQWQSAPENPHIWENQGWLKFGWDSELNEALHACPVCAKKENYGW